MADKSFDRLRALAENDPEQFRRLIAGLKDKVVHPHPGQAQVINSKARFRVMNCGRRWGKTKIAAKIIVAKARKDKQMLWWVAPTYKVVKRGYAEVLRQLPDGVLTHEPPPETNFDAGRSVILRFKNGTRMEFYSAERPEGMLGEGVDFAVLDEAAIMPSRIWNQIVSPTLMDREGGALMISTPRGRNWFYKSWLMGQEAERKDWQSWTFTSADNPYLPEGEVERMRADMPRLEFEQEVLAKFLAAGSSTFVLGEKCVEDVIVDDNTHLLRDPNGTIRLPRGHVVLGIDLARTYDWTVLYGCRASDRRNVYFERMQAVTWPEQKRRIRRAVRTLMRAGAENVMLVIDSTGVGDPVAEDLESEGYDVVGLNFTTHKTNMVRLLAKDLEENRAFIIEPGKDEFEDYAMTMSPAGKMTYSAPEGQHDDVVAAKMLAHWGCVNEGVPDVQIISEEGPSDPMIDRDPWEFDDDDGFYGDGDTDYGLLDDPVEAAVAVGLADTSRPPTPEELLSRADVWLA